MKRRHPEQDFQRTLVDTLARVLAPDVFFLAIPNGGWRSKVEAAILKGQGVKPGVPDLIIIQDGHAFGLELKAAKGRLSEIQECVHEQMRRAGVPIRVVRSMAEAWDALTAWGIRLRIKGMGNVNRTIPGEASRSSP